MKAISSGIQAWSLALGLVAFMALIAIMVGCAPSRLQPPKAIAPTTVPGTQFVEVLGSLPSLDLEGMVEFTDAVVVGTLTADLGTKLHPGDANDPPHYYVEFKEYELTVERSLYPESGFPDKIALLIQVGAVSGNSLIQVIGDSDLPTFQDGEKVLLFVESLKDDDKFGHGIGRPVPEGFTKDTYYQVLMGSGFGKLTPDGDKWTDASSRKTVSIDDVLSAIESQKGDSS